MIHDTATLDTCGCCEGDLPPPSVSNPPGLPSLRYRIGTHGSFLRRMLARLPLQTLTDPVPSPARPLAPLSTRAADDPSIALLDAWAAAADVLTFYQERIANEGFLRTATERRSVLELARAIGYELNPGVAASTFLGFTIEAATGAPGRAAIPQGTRVLSVPGQNERPQTYETIEALDARAEWNALRPVQTRPQVLTAASTDLWITGLDTQLRTGDVLLIIYQASQGARAWNLRSVTDVIPDAIAGRTRVHWKDPLQLGFRVVPAGLTVATPSVFAMRQRAGLFGHDAPEWRAMPLNVMSAYAGYKVPEDPNRWMLFEWPNLEIPVGSTRVDLDGIYPKIVSGSLLVLQTPTTIARPPRVVAMAAGSSNEVQFATAMRDGRLLHTIRHAQGDWQPVGDMAAATGISGTVRALAAAAGAGGDVQYAVYAVGTQDAHLWHTIRFANGTWQQPTGDMGAAAGITGTVQALAAAAGAGGDVQYAVYAVGTQDAKLWHTIRFANGSWQQQVGDMGTTAGIPGTVQALAAAAGTGGEVQFAVATQDGHLWHTIRFANGSWQQAAGDMASAMGITGHVRALAAAAGGGNDVQFAAAMDDGHLWHTIRFGDMSWQQAGDMGAVAGIAGRVRSMAASAADTGEVQFTLAMEDGRLLTTLRRADGSWQPASDMRQPAAFEPPKTGLYEVANVVTRARADFTLSRQVTSTALTPTDDLHAYPLRDTTVFAQSTPLPLAVVPIPDPILGYRIALDRVVAGLDVGRAVIVSGKCVRVRVGKSPIMLIPAVGPPVLIQVGDSLIVTEAPTTLVGGSVRVRDTTGIEGVVNGPSPGQLVREAPLDSDPLVNEVAWVDHVETAVTGTTLVLTSSLRHWFDRTTVAVKANVARSTHGESVREVLGSGSAAQPNQRFKLRKPPLTFVAAQTPSGARSALAVWIDDVRWDEAPSLYGQPANAHVYIIRLEDDGTTWVIFGDGEQGARLPSGTENVVAAYRSGIGLQGQVGAGRLTLMQTRPFGVRDVTNPLSGAGAAPAEKLDEARRNAPLTVTTINRLVSLRDYENFAAAFAGIAKAEAVPTWDGRRHVVFITLGGVAGSSIDPGSAPYVNLTGAIRLFGDPVREFRLHTYQPLPFRLNAEVLVDDHHQPVDVLAAVRAALTDAYAFDARTFGQPVTAAEIVTTIQHVAGVTGTRLRQLYLTQDGPSAAEPAEFLTALSGRWDDGLRQALPAQLLLLDPQGLTISEMSP